MKHIESYVHGNSIGVLVELKTTDDFVTRTDEFRALARDLAMQIAAMDPSTVDGGELENVISMIDRTALSERTEAALMTQEFVKDTTITVRDRVAEAERVLGSPISVTRFVRFDAAAS